MRTICVVLVIIVATVDSFGQYNYEWERYDIDTNSSIRALYVVNQDVVWIGGSAGFVARTINGGVTWEELIVPGGNTLDFRDIHAFDENNALIMSAGSGANSKIFRTNDGGKKWQVVHGNNYREGFFNGMDFWDENNGVLAGDAVNGCLYIAITNNGGETWKKVDNYSIPEIEYQEVSFAASGTHVATMRDSSAWIGTGGRTARIFRTTNMGESWEVSYTPIIQGLASTGVFSIAFKDHNNGIAIGGDYTRENYGEDNVIISNDKGESWSLVQDTQLEFRSCIRYIDGMYIVVGPSGANYSFTDGKSWNPIGGGIGFHTLSIGGSKKAIWAAGSGGKVARLKEMKKP